MGLQQGAGKHFGVTLVWLCHLRRGTTPGGIGPLGTQTLGHPTLPGTPHPSFLATSAPHGTPNPCTPVHGVLISPCTPISLHSAFLGTPALAPPWHPGPTAPPAPQFPQLRGLRCSYSPTPQFPFSPHPKYPRTPPNIPEHLRTPNTSNSEHLRTPPNTPFPSRPPYLQSRPVPRHELLHDGADPRPEPPVRPQYNPVQPSITQYNPV